MVDFVYIALRIDKRGLVTPGTNLCPLRCPVKRAALLILQDPGTISLNIIRKLPLLGLDRRDGCLCSREALEY